MFKFWSVYRLWNGRPTIGYNVPRAEAVPDKDRDLPLAFIHSP
jgi:hypothetical protein